MFSWLINKTKTFFKITEEYQKTDPLCCCEFHKQVGCTHVDGILCDVNTCNTRTDYQLQMLEQEKHKKPVSKK